MGRGRARTNADNHLILILIRVHLRSHLHCTERSAVQVSASYLSFVCCEAYALARYQY